ncbi:TetR/AcrR family transcriptional regulator [bacterium]|nr:MAG: TetR/AcrR family transcriptional regulator [bacterium]
MAIKERKEDEKKRRKDLILQAAITLIQQKGFENTTMDDIAQQAELSKGTLYLYFADKSNIHYAIKKKALILLNETLQSILQKDYNGATMIKEMLSSLFDLIEKNKAFTQAMMLYEHNVKADLTHGIEEQECYDLQTELMMLILRSVQIGLVDGSMKSDVPPKILTIIIINQITGILTLILSPSPKKQKILAEYNHSVTQLMEVFLNNLLNINE